MNIKDCKLACERFIEGSLACERFHAGQAGRERQMTELLKCTECSWCAETPEDGEVILDNGDIISLEHIGCLECGGMLEVMPDKPEADTHE